MGYGLIFVVGLLTSLHCIAMCGGIVLSQGIKRNERRRSTPVKATGCAVPSSPGPKARLLRRASSTMGDASFPTRSSAASSGRWAPCSAFPRHSRASCRSSPGRSCSSLACGCSGILPLAFAAEGPVPRLRRTEDAFRRGGTGTFRGRPPERPDAVRAAADHAGLRTGNRKLPCRRSFDVPLQPGNGAAPPGLRRDQRLPQRQIQPSACSRQAASWSWRSASSCSRAG